MKTTGNKDLDMENVRSRARRLRLPGDAKSDVVRDWSGPGGHLDRVGVGLLVAFLIDVVFVIANVGSEHPIATSLRWTPLAVLFAPAYTIGPSVAAIFIAGATGHWRVAGGVFLFQAGVVWLVVGFLGFIALVGG